MRTFIIGVILLCSAVVFSQKPDSVAKESWQKIYRASATKINDLVHTKLDVSFDYANSWMYGKAWITLHPHFYATDSLRLDAKAMNISEVSLVKAGKHISLKYSYDSLSLNITLDRMYKGGENYTVFIQYIARPDDVTLRKKEASSESKGLYFINPKGTDKEKPVQIWTQGETESNSGWFPTIDKPNQKTTDEISITVPSKYLTLSNGVLASQKKNADGTRTDTWKMTQPHAPYLVMMAVGEYSVVKDSYKGKEISYYVEKEFAPVARQIFGLTPEMIAFYSRITGIDYPWPKYAQVVCREFGGAMENTTATIHSDEAQQDARQLLDENSWETTIAHELFHQWFGDYVTTESWSNITLNESFADVSETLWMEYKHGRDAGDERNYNGMQNYLQSGSEKKDLVRFYYKDEQQLFDAVSYKKGGRILNMLRYYVGDSAFFKSLNLYLRTKKFQSAEAQELRLAFEEVTGQDLNWYWNQWYYGSGHPKLDISYAYAPDGKTASVFIKQTQPGKVFRFRIAVDIYQGTEKKRYYEWVDQADDTLTYSTNSKPDLINVDGEKILLCEKTDHKTLDNYIFQYTNAGSYVDRREAIDYAAANQGEDPKALNLLKISFNDKYPGLRIYALQKLNTGNDPIETAVEPLLLNLAEKDPKTLVRAKALSVLGKYKMDAYKPLFLKAINDSSYAIAGNALLALSAIDSGAAIEQAKKLSVQQVKGTLADAIDNLMYKYAGESDFDNLSNQFDKLPLGNAKFMKLQQFADFLKRVKNTDNFRKGINMIVNFRESIPEAYKDQTLPYINGMILNGIATSKQSEGLTEHADYVRSKLPVGSESKSAVEVPVGILQKYTGEYELNGATVNVVMKDDKSLTLVSNNQPGMELVPVSNTDFNVKYMEDISVKFTMNEGDKATEMTLTTPGGKMIATRKK